MLASGDHLNFRPGDRVPADLRAEMVQEKAALIAELQSRGAGGGVPPDRPIRADHAAWLLTLDAGRRRAWWRDVVSRYARCEDWARAEDEATATWCKPGRDADRPAAESPAHPGELPPGLRQWPPAERYAVAELERGGVVPRAVELVDAEPS